MKLLILILSIIILIIYTICYYIFPTEVSIYQTDIEKFDINVLSSRQPIVISDYVQNPEDIINSWFKYNIINFDGNDNNNDNGNDNDNDNDNGNGNGNGNGNDNDNGNDNGNDNDNDNGNDNDNDNGNDNNDWKHNNHKYLFINAFEDTEIIIYKAQITKINPTPEDKIIIIKLKQNQSLILPFKWKYYGNKINIWNIDDIITFSFGRLF
jgi:hypothetical protein